MSAIVLLPLPKSNIRITSPAHFSLPNRLQWSEYLNGSLSLLCASNVQDRVAKEFVLVLKVCPVRSRKLSVEESIVEKPERGLVLGELLDTGTQQKWSSLQMAFLGCWGGFANWVWAPQGCGCVSHRATLPLPIFPILSSPSPVHLGLSHPIGLCEVMEKRKDPEYFFLHTFLFFSSSSYCLILPCLNDGQVSCVIKNLLLCAFCFLAYQYLLLNDCLLVCV